LVKTRLSRASHDERLAKSQKNLDNREVHAGADMSAHYSKPLAGLIDGQVQRLADILRRDVLECPPDLSVAEAAKRMIESKCGSIVVTEYSNPIGIWTERDALLVDIDQAEALDRPIRDVMSHPVKTLNQDMTIESATLRFRDDNVRHYVVVDDAANIVGMVSQTDVVRHHDVKHFLSLRDVRAVVRRATLILQGSASLSHAAMRMHANGTDAAIVIWGDGRRGIITERDLLRAVASRSRSQKVGEVASHPIVAVPQSVSVLEARQTMEMQGFRHLGVTDGEGAIVGILSYSDILASVEFSLLRYVEGLLDERSRALHLIQNRLNGALDQLENANLELLRFADALTNMLHSPLREVSVGLGLLARREDLKADDDKASLLAMSHAGVQKLEKSIADLIEYARAPNLDGPVTPINTASLIEVLITGIRPSLESIGTRIDVGNMLAVSGDARKVESLFATLFEQVLEVKPSHILLTSQIEKEGCRFTLSLNTSIFGSLKPATLFELTSSHPADSSHATTGLGFALARRLAERLGGRIWAEMSPGGGSVINVILPSAGEAVR
jgi:CBS domain-containing protein